MMIELGLNAVFAGEAIKPTPNTLTSQQGIVFLEVDAFDGQADVEVTHPSDYAGIYRVDLSNYSTGPINVVPPRIIGRLAYRRSLAYMPGIWLCAEAGIPSVTAELNSEPFPEVAGASYVVQRADQGQTLILRETVQDSRGSRYVEQAIAIQSTPALDTDSGRIVHYPPEGITSSSWLSYHDPADDLTTSGFRDSLPVFADSSQVSFTGGIYSPSKGAYVGGDNLALASGRLVAALYANPKFELHVITTLSSNLVDGSYQLISEYIPGVSPGYFSFYISVAEGRAILGVKIHSPSGRDVCKLSGGQVPLGQKVRLSFQAEGSMGSLRVNGTPVINGSIDRSQLWSGSSSHFGLGDRTDGNLVRRGLTGQLHEIYATTSDTAGQVAAVLDAKHGI